MELQQPPPVVSNMFGLIVAGEMVRSNFILPNPADPTKYLIHLQDLSKNHLVVFLTGAEPFPIGYGGLIYINTNNNSGSDNWTLLGSISNEKPSAIFRVSDVKPNSKSCNNFAIQQQPLIGVQIGVSIETLQGILNATPADKATPTSLPTKLENLNRMIESFFNYVSSFNSEYVSLSTVRQWYETYKRRLEMGN